MITERKDRNVAQKYSRTYLTTHEKHWIEIIER